MTTFPNLAARPPVDFPASQHADLHVAAQQLETQFLAEMLKSTDLGQHETGFGGGAGEDQFKSFLHQAQAERMVSAGGIGLAESIFTSLLQGVKG